MIEVSLPVRVGREDRFGRLMELYADNYRMLQLLLDDTSLDRSRFVSCLGGELAVYYEITERQRHTTFVRMSYLIWEDGVATVDPDAHLRIYHDAEVAEALHCYPGTISRPLFGALVPVANVVEHRWRANMFLHRWLEYLIELGHGLRSLQEFSGDDWPLDRAAVPERLDSE